MPFDCNLAILKPVKAIIDFFTDKIWNADFNALKTLKRGGYSFCRLLVVATRGFFEDRCTLQSCALTYVTMVSLVPILAVALSFCKGMRRLCAVRRGGGIVFKAGSVIIK